MCAGDVLVDVVVRELAGAPPPGGDAPAAIAWHGGGSAANTACWLVAAGVPDVVFAGRVGDDDAGRAAVAALERAGVAPRVVVDPDRATGTCVVLVDAAGERTMRTDRGACAVPVEAEGAWVHVSGAAVSRSPRSVDPGPLAAPDLTADLLLPSAAEATALTGEADPEAAARALAATGREVVVTLGAAGALWTDGRDLAHAPAVTTAVVDTAGAGDAFAAGLLAARLAGAVPREALAAGCALAARCVAAPGARPAR